MASRKKTITTTRRAALRGLLEQRRRDLQADLQARVRTSRTGGRLGVGDALDHCDADIQGDLDFALLQMRAETLTRIEAALVQLDAGTYGSCAECSLPIAEQRLRAMPFAVRCQGCEAARERERSEARALDPRSAYV